MTSYDPNILETIAKAQSALLPSKLLSGVGSGSFVENAALPWTLHILLPAGFSFDASVIREHVKDSASKDWPMYQIPKASVVSSPEMPESRFIKHDPVPLFHSGRTNDEKSCESELGLSMDDLMVDSRELIPGNFRHVLEILVEELDVYNDPYYKEISPLFITHLRTQLKEDMVNHFWFRLSGSLVWLKDHGVHLVILRFLFSNQRSRDNPKLSFVLAQVFDKEWRELKDVRLVFPTNDLGDDGSTFKVGEQDFYSYRFPRLLPVPFHHDSGTSGTRYFGPEDPRAFVIRNKKGYDEPAFVFNAKHKKEVKGSNGDLQTREFRSIFTCFPFQLKKGKYVVDAKYLKETDDQIFTKIIEMNVVNQQKQGTNKNWSPLISSTLRKTLGYDEHVYFATRLDNLEVLRCDVVNDTGDCVPVHSDKGGIGPLRGGSPFLNVNTILEEQTDIPIDKIIPPGREIYVAFARAHLNNCGCGSKFYRPNLLIMTRDKVSYMSQNPNGKPEQADKYFYKLSHVSSFFSFHVPIDPWYVSNPYKICEGVSAVIPNGISNWKVDSIDVVDGRWLVKDKMTVAFSVSDFSVDRVNLRGILDVVLNSADGTLVLPPLSSKQNAFISQPAVDEMGNLVSGNIGFNSNNVQCALTESHKFCQKFGEDQKVLEDEFRDKDNKEANEEFDKKLKLFEDALKEQEAEERKAKEIEKQQQKEEEQRQKEDDEVKQREEQQKKEI